MRVRQRQSYDPGSFAFSAYHVGSNNSTVARQGSGLAPYVKKYEYMQDVGFGRGRFNPVSHIKYTGEPRNRSGIYYGMVTTSPSDYYQVVMNRVWGATTLDSLLGAMPTIPSSEIEDLNYRSFMAATTQISTEVSVPNFLIELREVKDLIPKIQGFLKTISGGFLNWQFGWKPLLSDIRKLLKSAESVRSRIKYLKEIYEKPTTIHFGVSNFWSPEIADPGPRNATDAALEFGMTIFAPGPPVLPHSTVLTTYQCQYHSSITVYSTVSGLDAADSFLKGMLAALGFMNGAKVVWNALPWSWLIEWFVNLDRFLDQYDDKPFPGTINVLDSGYSIKESALLEVGGYFLEDVNLLYDRNAVVPWTQFCTYHLERYTRYCGLPISTALFRDGSLTTTQWAILLALIHQRS